MTRIDGRRGEVRQLASPLEYKTHEGESHLEIGAMVSLKRTLKKDQLRVCFDKEIHTGNAQDL